MFILAPIVMLSLVSVGSLAILLAILVPLNGALVRFRAHYNPKGLQLDPEAGVQPRTGPVITSFFAMLVRVYKIEVRLPLCFDIRAPLQNTTRDGRACTRDSVRFVLGDSTRNY